MQIVALREIRSAARRPATYWSRLIAAAAAAVVILSMLFQLSVGIITGRTLFFCSIGLATLLCLGEGIRQAATSIVDERSEVVLGRTVL